MRSDKLKPLCRQYCSRINNHQMIEGTAPWDRWILLIECPKPWSGVPIESSRLPRNIVKLYQSFPKNYRPRLVLTSIQSLTSKERDPADQRIWVRLIRRYQGQTYCLDLPYSAEQIQKEISQKPRGITDKRSLVICTHGSRDTCCALYGIPLYQKALELAPPGWEILEASHLGGHRFAPVMFTLPSWHCYGRVQPDQLSDFFRKVEQRSYQKLYFRGSGYLPQPAQALEAHLWKVFGSRFTTLRQCQILRHQSRFDLEGYFELYDQNYTFKAILNSFKTTGIGSCSDINNNKAHIFLEYQIESLHYEVLEKTP